MRMRRFSWTSAAPSSLLIWPPIASIVAWMSSISSATAGGVSLPWRACCSLSLPSRRICSPRSCRSCASCARVSSSSATARRGVSWSIPGSRLIAARALQCCNTLLVIGDLCNQALALLMRQRADVGIEFLVDISERLHRTVSIDVGRLVLFIERGKQVADQHVHIADLFEQIIFLRPNRAHGSSANRAEGHAEFGGVGVCQLCAYCRIGLD